MDRLTDDALLEVLLYLSTEDLLACRLVCKRLGTLAVHPHLWRLKCFSVSESASRACPVLRLAPCLDRLLVTLPLKNCLHLYTTRCAVARLDLRVDNFMKDAALIIQRQSFLRRLKSMTITLGRYLRTDAAILLTTLASTRGLTYLKINVSGLAGVPSFDMTQSLQSIAVPSSIRTFIFNGGPVHSDFCNFVLARHAATLETVQLMTLLSNSTTSLLSGLPNLRRLAYSIPPGQEDMPACKSLRILTLSFCSNDPSGMELLRQAEQLREVTLFCYFIITTESVLPETILTLASSRVEKLSVLIAAAANSAVAQTHAVHWGRALLGVLPLLPVLQELTLNWRTDELLRGINPTTAPTLRILTLHCGRVQPCTPGFVRRDAFRTLLSSNPSVKVQVSPSCATCL